MVYEATADLALIRRDQTPLQDAGRPSQIGLVPILRANLGMVEGIWRLMPSSEVWHIGLYRDGRRSNRLSTITNCPSSPVSVCLVLDPMLATGGSAVATIDILKRWGAKKIKYIGIIGAPEGIENLSRHHPDVPIHLAAVDQKLNEVGYILPGLGDAGDRQIGTA